MKINIIDYIGYCNDKKIPTGHIIKTLTDFNNLIQEEVETELIIPRIYKNYINGKNVKYIDIDISELNNSKKYRRLKKSKYTIKKIFIVYKILNEKDINNLWFINTDFWLFFVLAFKKSQKNIYVTNYINYTEKKGLKGIISKFIYRKALKRINKVFVTNKDKEDNKHLYIPDYYYDKNQYEQYKKMLKNKEVLCIGSMNDSKDIKGLIEAFSINGIQLDIMGTLLGNNKNLKNILCSNINVKNVRLSDEEYYKEFASAKFCILPYKKENYMQRSSGVILEAAFLGVGIIAPKFLIEFSGFEGFSYEDINELKFIKIEEFNKQLLSKVEYNNNIIKCYEKNIIKNRLLSEFKKNE